MSSNEETISATDVAGANEDVSQVIDLDDVEGHGMREVAAGLGAAAILAGGGTAAAAAVGMHPSMPSVKSVTPSISDPVSTVDRTTDWAVQTARTTRDTGLNRAATTAADTASTAAEQVSATSTLAGHVTTGTQQTAAAFVEAGNRIANDEAATATQRVSATKASMSSTASTFASQTTATATAASQAAANQAATALRLTTSTANALETTIVATVENLNPQAGAGTSGMGSTGWVTFSLGGENIASVQVSNGQATITVKTASLGGKVLQAVYSGDAVHSSSMRSITL